MILASGEAYINWDILVKHEELDRVALIALQRFSQVTKRSDGPLINRQDIITDRQTGLLRRSG